MDDVIILGSGLSGLVAAKKIIDKTDSKVTIIDKNKKMGGMQRSLEYNREKYSPFGCFLFEKDKIIENFMEELDLDLQKQKREMRVNYKNKLYNYPFQLNLDKLPFYKKFSVLLTYLFAFKKNDYDNFKDWANSQFGIRLANMMINPHTKKKYGVYFDLLDWKQFDGKMPKMTLKELWKSLFGKTEDWDFDSYFYSPKGGMNSVIKGLVNYLKESGRVCFINDTIVSIPEVGRGKGTVICEDCYKDYDKLISTIPINIFDSVFSNEKNNFAFASMGLYSFVIPKDFFNVDYHAIYEPNKEKPWHRIVFPHKYQKDWNKDFNVVVFEVPNPTRSLKQYTKMLEFTTKDFSFPILSEDKRIIKNAYPIITKENKNLAGKVKREAKKRNITLFGRAAEYDYIYLPEIIKRSEELV